MKFYGGAFFFVYIFFYLYLYIWGKSYIYHQSPIPIIDRTPLNITQNCKKTWSGSFFKLLKP